MTPSAFLSLVPRDPPTFKELSYGEGIGLAFDAFAGLASTIAAIFVLVLIFYRLVSEEWEAFHALHISVIALFFAEVIQGLGHALELKWVLEKKVYTGTFCTAQGLMQQLGELSVALFTLTIAIQTFLSIYRLAYLDVTISKYAIIILSVFVILWVGVGFGIHTRGKEYYAAPTPYWCWIGKNFKGERLGGEYVWFWVTLFVSIALYFPLFLLHFKWIKPGTSWYAPRAYITATHPTPDREHSRVENVADGPETGDPNRSPYQHAHARVSSNTGEPSHAGEPRTGDSNSESPPGRPSHELSNNREAITQKNPKLLWSAIFYPILYCILVMPLSVVRWIGFREEAVGKSPNRPVATLLVGIIFTLSGILNALLYLLTRANFFKPNEDSEVLRMTGVAKSREPE